MWKGGRSEGLAVASLDMFKKGVFSVGKGYTVDGRLRTCYQWFCGYVVTRKALMASCGIKGSYS